MSKIRRTEAEIKAGFPVAAKKAGKTLKEWKAEQCEIKVETKKRKKLIQQETSTRLRRTLEEINVGLSVEEKRNGVTIEDKRKINSSGEKVIKTTIKSKTPYEEEVLDRVDMSDDGTVRTVFKSRQTTVEKIIEKPVIKEIRILNESTGRERTVKEILDEEIGKCKWEWKHIPLDNKFKVTMLGTLGKQGWRFAFMINWKIVDPNSKKLDELCFQRMKT